MLAQHFRFHGYGSLKFLYRNGRTFRVRSLSLRLAYNDRRSSNRCAVIVTKKVHKSSPRRNRIRRRIYEIVRTNWEHIKPTHDLLINVYDPQAIDMPYDELERAVIEVLKQAGVWQEGSNSGKAA